MFVGRKELLDNIRVRIEEVGQSCLLIGIRGVGKTSLLKHIKDLDFGPNERPHKCIYINASLYGRSDFWSKMEMELTNEEDSTAIYDSGEDVKDAASKFLNKASNFSRKVIILVDNIDDFARVATATDLRTITHITKETSANVLFIATALIHPHVILHNENPVDIRFSPFVHFHTFYVLPLRAQEVKTLVDETDFPKLNADSVNALSGGHPGLLEYIREYIQENVSSSFFEQQLMWYVKIAWLSDALFKDLDQGEKRVLQLLLSRFPKTMPKAQMDKKVSATWAKDLNQLVGNKGIVKTDGESYSIFSSIIGHLWKGKLYDETGFRMEDERIAPGNLSVNMDGDPVAFRIENPLTLSKLEARLLQYLVENSGKVCTVEDLLDNVWPPGRSRSVVERGINRLRAKIELVSNNPQILTIPGVGYKYTGNRDSGIASSLLPRPE